MIEIAFQIAAGLSRLVDGEPSEAVEKWQFTGSAAVSSKIVASCQSRSAGWVECRWPRLAEPRVEALYAGLDATVRRYLDIIKNAAR